MRIRSITYFLNPGQTTLANTAQAAGSLLRRARAAFTAAGYEVQTMRMATTPFSGLLADESLDQALQLVQRIENEAAAEGIDYISFGPAQPDCLACYTWIPELIAASRNAFFSGALAGADGKISLQAVRACGEIVRRAASITPDGFANLRFTALANVPAGSPFFPAAYHQGRQPAFAVATEAADLAVEAFAPGTGLEEGRERLIASLQEHADRLSQVGDDLSAMAGVAFNGIDFTLAPYPETSLSFGTALERVGAPAVGLAGTLAAAAILADSLDQARFPRAGFCGLMLPVLEDQRLAERAAEGRLHVNDLLLYSAVCGTGLDTVPLPGSATADQLSAVLLDLAALAYRLDKPLTARLMPIPGKETGDPTHFDFSYFANSRVLALAAEALTGPLAGDERFELKPRAARKREN